MKKTVIAFTLLLSFAFCLSGLAQGTPTCDGISSPGNVYPCCTAGNCTWWAWKMMRDNWGASEVDWHDAKDWATNAANHGLNVISIPAVGTIGVSTTLSSTGHVAYVTAVNNDSSVYVSEMDCGSTGVFYNKYYAAGTFNAGFIYPNYYNGTPGINSLTSGTPTHSGIAQNITFSISNEFLAIEEVHITFPSGGHAILSGSAITSISGTSMTINAVLSTAGTWHIEAINNNGTISNNYAFTVI